MIKREEVKSGDVLYPDADFTCIEKNDPVEVAADEEGHLYFCCGEGLHYLAGQISEDGKYYVGLAKEPWK